MREMKMDEVKKCEIDILNYFADLCEAEGLKYYLAYGTVLGAVRHKGFIPWDDDIDVMMPREDFEKVIHIKKNSRYEILSCVTNRNFDAPLAKIIDKETILYQSYNQVDKKQLGIYIDIFVLDGLPERNMESQVFYKNAERLRCFWGLSVRKVKSRSRNLMIAVVKTFVSIPFRIMGGNFWSNILYRYAGKYTYVDAIYTGVVCFGEGNKKERINKSVIEPGTYIFFEDLKYRVPSNWNLYLTNMYGNYMDLPPLKERLSKHNFKAYMR